MRYIIKAHKLEPEIELVGRFPSKVEMVTELTEDGFVIRSYQTEDGLIIAGDLLEKECLIKELKKESRKTKYLAKKMIKPFVALLIWNGLITIGLILISILSSLR